MSLTFFRSKRNSYFTVAIFGAIIITFIAWGGASKMDSTSSSALTSVNGEEIPYVEFQRALNRQLEMYGQMMGGGKKLSEQIVQLVERQIASALVMRKALSQKAATVGIVVGDEEIMKILESNTAFQDPTLKRFSPTVYQAVLEANNFKPASFEAGLREELAAERMRALLEESVTVSDREVEDHYRLQAQTMNLGVATFDPVKLMEKKKLNITEQAIQDYFSKHQGEYLSQEKRAATFAVLPTKSIAEKITATDDDIKKYFESKVQSSNDSQWAEARAHAYHILIADSSEKGLKRAQELAKKITNLDSFMTMAQKNSEDYSNASKGGDLGYFNDTAMVKPFTEAAFGKAKLNSTIGPVKTDFGYHLIWVTDRTTNAKTLENRKQEIAYSIKRDLAKERLDVLRKDFEQKLKGSKSDITESLREQTFEFVDVTEFDSHSRHERVPFVLLMDALKAPLSEWQGPTEHDGAIYFYKVTKLIAPQPMTLADARPLIMKRIQNEETERYTKAVHERLKKGDLSWDKLTAEGIDLSDHKDIKAFQLTEVPGLGPSETLVQAAQKLNATNSISAPLMHENKWVILKAAQWKDAGASISDADRKKTKDEILTKKRASVLDAYLQDLVKTAKIPDSFRKKYQL